MKKIQLKVFLRQGVCTRFICVPMVAGFLLFCSVTAKSQDTLKIQGPQIKVNTTDPVWKAYYKAPVKFVPIPLADKNGKSIPSDQVIKLPNGNSMTAGTYINRLNDLQQKLSAKGIPLGKTKTIVVSELVTPTSTLDGRRALAPRPIRAIRTQAQLDSFTSPKFQSGNTVLVPLGSYSSVSDREKVHQSLISYLAPGRFIIKPLVKRFNPPVAQRLLRTINETTTKDLHFGSVGTFLAGLKVSLTRYAKVYGPGTENAIGNLSEFKISGSGRVYAAVINHSFDVFATNGEIYVPADSSKQMTAKIVMTVLGTTILNMQEGYNLHKVITGTKSKTFDKSFAASFPILPFISFYGKIGIKGSVGYSYSGELDRTFIKGEFKPMCNIAGYAEAAISDPAGVGKIGVKSNLTFLNGNADLTGWFGIYNANSSQIGLGYGYNISFYVEILSGKLEIFYELCVPDWVPWIGGDCTDYSTTLFSWNGYRNSGTFANYRNLFVIDTRPVVAVKTR